MGSGQIKAMGEGRIYIRDYKVWHTVCTDVLCTSSERKQKSRSRRTSDVLSTMGLPHPVPKKRKW